MVPYSAWRTIRPPILRTSHFGVAREPSVTTRLSTPGTQITSPRMQASKPWRVTSFTSPTMKAGSWLTLSIGAGRTGEHGGGRHAQAQGGNGHAGALHFLRQRLGQRQHKRLAGRVSRQRRNRQKRGDGRDIQNASTPALPRPLGHAGEKLGNSLPKIAFDGQVFRATRKNIDPLATSRSGGRWMPASVESVLYTSMQRDGALPEISFHWSRWTPMPS